SYALGHFTVFQLQTGPESPSPTSFLVSVSPSMGARSFRPGTPAPARGPSVATCRRRRLCPGEPIQSWPSAPDRRPPPEQGKASRLYAAKVGRRRGNPVPIPTTSPETLPSF